ncbi:hypothetical protein CC1G_02292 [Coprinopsis cinerea okayama7|uniref:Uncharacterized protein n=1 Tax=Coprinopsis cinerea (strain Okayama-7 / 130 / ATCC MYA-4618 / FGSC 9003) TaxID=240176 RepID=A8N7N5_COPC7|nr:hypothetical protein CC1G_02292 [Coprinopsis cinerea okayama7\|eukprot:XP_001830841.1 hypothetical protein CC1G_02292 [Coprinopsis cinerea okayama7\
MNRHFASILKRSSLLLSLLFTLISQVDASLLPKSDKKKSRTVIFTKEAGKTVCHILETGERVKCPNKTLVIALVSVFCSIILIVGIAILAFFLMRRRKFRVGKSGKGEKGSDGASEAKPQSLEESCKTPQISQEGEAKQREGAVEGPPTIPHHVLPPTDPFLKAAPQ